MNSKQLSNFSFLLSLKYGIWILWTPLWVFGTIERVVAAFADHSISPVDFLQISIAAFFLFGWLLLKPSLYLCSDIEQS
ncbi:hypothetical protein H6F89_32045 [Cyanobacteria bacterium FACHB-63]|uniref:hypothetical protein n=1 Tax=unclassified Leptolyngbya TaxID=2650499 RepID=UPI0016819DB5|nr:hypothetical protein [Leptolyngbya sp. FACHB-17]MBD1822997.1 hypothetical protein [Cyanobacteria bacterium FACHB-DQ100]MBD1847929.1 hypothetical protein [Cyanobacteria bacterium FACHB-63]MBD2080420.1 hypothetical protein [Leptolyngbya sp. FACHB-17]